MSVSTRAERIAARCRAHGVSVTGAFADLLAQSEPLMACEICGTRRKDRALCLDGGEGFIRGFLCDPCNRALGGLRHDPALLDRAAEYLRKPPPLIPRLNRQVRIRPEAA